MAKQKTGERKYRGVAYWRMSSAQEASIPQQRAHMLPVAQLEGVEIVPGGEFKDAAQSGGRMDRDEFVDMLAFCQRAKEQGEPVDAIVVFKTARLSRADSQETAHYIWEFRKAGVNLVLTKDRWFDFRNEADRTAFNIEQDYTNNRYLLDHADQVRRGKAASHRAGYFTGGRPAYGYDRVLLNPRGEVERRVPVNEKIGHRETGWKVGIDKIPEDDTDPSRRLVLETIRWMYQRYADVRISFRTLAGELNAKGIPGPGCGKARTRQGVLVRPEVVDWDTDNVENVLTNPIYTGIYQYGKTTTGRYCREIGGKMERVTDPDRGVERNPNPASVEVPSLAIVSRELWDRVQARIAERRRNAPRARKSDFVLAGLLKCGQCGANMVGSTLRRDNHTYKRYVCSSSRPKVQKCPCYGITEDQLLPVLLRKLEETYLSDERIGGLEAQLQANVESKHRAGPPRARELRQQITTMSEEIVQARRNLLRVKNPATFAEAEEELDTWVEKRHRLQKELEGIEREQLVPVERQKEKMRQAVDRLRLLRDQVKKADPLQLNAALSQLITRIDLYFDRPRDRARFKLTKGVVTVNGELSLIESEVTIGG